MKKLLLLIAIFLGIGLSSYAQDAVQTCLFGSAYNSKAISAYNQAWTATNNGFVWDIVNFNNNNNGWEYVRCGSKNGASVATITTQSAIPQAISTVVVTIDNITASSINSIDLLVSNTSDFASAKSYSVNKAAGAQSVTIPEPAANMYYRLTFDCAQSSNNGTCQVSKVAYYAGDAPEGPQMPDAPTGVISVDEALQLVKDGYVGEATVKGIVSRVTNFNATYGSVTYYLSDNGEATNELQIYGGLGLNGARFSAMTDVEVGAAVVVKGNLKMYNSAPEMDLNSEMISYTSPSGGGGETPGPEQPGDMDGETVTQPFTTTIGLPTGNTGAAVAEVVTATATDTGITYNLYGSNINTGGYLMLVSKNIPDAYISWTLDRPLLQLQMKTTGGASKNAVVDVYANDVLIREGLALSEVSYTYNVNIPEAYQAAGTVYKVVSTANYNTQFASFTYVVGEKAAEPESTVTFIIQGNAKALEMSDEEGNAIPVVDNRASYTYTGDAKVLFSIYEGEFELKYDDKYGDAIIMGWPDDEKPGYFEMLYTFTPEANGAEVTVEVSGGFGGLAPEYMMEINFTLPEGFNAAQDLKAYLAKMNEDLIANNTNFSNQLTLTEEFSPIKVMLKVGEGYEITSITADSGLPATVYTIGEEMYNPDEKTEDSDPNAPEGETELYKFISFDPQDADIYNSSFNVVIEAVASEPVDFEDFTVTPLTIDAGGLYGLTMEWKYPVQILDASKIYIQTPTYEELTGENGLNIVAEGNKLIIDVANGPVINNSPYEAWTYAGVYDGGISVNGQVLKTSDDPENEYAGVSAQLTWAGGAVPIPEPEFTPKKGYNAAATISEIKVNWDGYWVGYSDITDSWEAVQDRIRIYKEEIGSWNYTYENPVNVKVSYEGAYSADGNRWQNTLILTPAEVLDDPQVQYVLVIPSETLGFKDKDTEENVDTYAEPIEAIFTVTGAGSIEVSPRQWQEVDAAQFQGLVLSNVEAAGVQLLDASKVKLYEGYLESDSQVKDATPVAAGVAAEGADDSIVVAFDYDMVNGLYTIIIEDGAFSGLSTDKNDSNPLYIQNVNSYLGVKFRITGKNMDINTVKVTAEPSEEQAVESIESVKVWWGDYYPLSIPGDVDVPEMMAADFAPTGKSVKGTMTVGGQTTEIQWAISRQPVYGSSDEAEVEYYNYALVYTPAAPITIPGSYTFTVPAGSVNVYINQHNDIPNAEVSLMYTVESDEPAIPEDAYIVYYDGDVAEGLTQEWWWNASWNMEAENPAGSGKVFEFKATDGGTDASMGLMAHSGDITGPLHDGILNFKYYATGTGKYTVRLTCGKDNEYNYDFEVSEENTNSWNLVSINIPELFPNLAKGWNENSNLGEDYVFSIIVSEASSDAAMYFEYIYYTNVDDAWEAPEIEIPEPETVPVPTQDAINVLSFMSYYGNNVNCNIGSWGQSTIRTEKTIDGQPVWALMNFNYLGLVDFNIDISGYDYMHVDYWTPQSEGTSFGFVPISLDPTKDEPIWVANEIKVGEWNSYDVPLEFWSNVDLESIKQLKFVANLDGTTKTQFGYIANVYFWKEGTSLPELPQWTSSPYDGERRQFAEDLLRIQWGGNTIVPASGNEVSTEGIEVTLNMVEDIDVLGASIVSWNPEGSEGDPNYKEAEDNCLAISLDVMAGFTPDGTYEVKIPAGIVNVMVDGVPVPNKEITFSYTVDSTPTVYLGDYTVTPANNSEVTVEELETVIVNFNNLSVTVVDPTLMYVEEGGNTMGVRARVNALADDNHLTAADVKLDGNNVVINLSSYVEAGKSYTLIIPEGTFNVNTDDGTLGNNEMMIVYVVKETVSEPAENSLYFTDFSIELSKLDTDYVTAEVPVSLNVEELETPYMGFQFDITLPEGITIPETGGFTLNEAFASTESAPGMSGSLTYGSYTKDAPNTWRVIAKLPYNADGYTLTEDIITANVQTKYGDIEPGRYPVVIRNTVVFSDVLGLEIMNVTGHEGFVTIIDTDVKATEIVIESVTLMEPSIDKNAGTMVDEVVAGQNLRMEVSLLPEDTTDNIEDIVWSADNGAKVTPAVDEEGNTYFIIDTEDVDVPEGESVTVTITGVIGEEPDQAKIEYTVTVRSVFLGDSNDNRQVTVADVVTTANYIAKKTVSIFCFPNANVILNEVDGQQVINTDDLTATVDIVLNMFDGNRNPQNVRRSTRSMITNDRLVVDNFRAANNSQFSIAVGLDNSNSYAALQASVEIPAGMKVLDVTAGQRAAAHEIVWNVTEDGMLHVVVFSFTNAAFAEGEGALFNIVATADGCNDDIRIEAVHASDAQSNGYDLDFEGGLNMNGTSGVDGLFVNDSDEVRYFDVNGIEVRNPEAGQILIRVEGNKVEKFIVK